MYVEKAVIHLEFNLFRFSPVASLPPLSFEGVEAMSLVGDDEVGEGGSVEAEKLTSAAGCPPLSTSTPSSSTSIDSSTSFALVSPWK